MIKLAEHPKRERILEIIADQELENLILFDGLDEAILGLSWQSTGDPLVAYSVRKIIDCYTDMGMSVEEAFEFFDTNTACLYAGVGTPVLVYDVELEN